MAVEASSQDVIVACRTSWREQGHDRLAPGRGRSPWRPRAKRQIPMCDRARRAWGQRAWEEERDKKN